MVYSLHCPVSCKASFVREQPSRHQFLCRHRWAVKVFWRVEDIQPKCKFVRYDSCKIFIVQLQRLISVTVCEYVISLQNVLQFIVINWWIDYNLVQVLCMLCMKYDLFWDVFACLLAAVEADFHIALNYKHHSSG